MAPSRRRSRRHRLRLLCRCAHSRRPLTPRGSARRLYNRLPSRQLCLSTRRRDHHRMQRTGWLPLRTRRFVITSGGGTHTFAQSILRDCSRIMKWRALASIHPTPIARRGDVPRPLLNDVGLVWVGARIGRVVLLNIDLLPTRRWIRCWRVSCYPPFMLMRCP